MRAEIYSTDCLTAEAAETVENTYRDVNIAFANEMALMCESLGVDVYEVRALVARGALVTCHDPYVRRADFEALEWGTHADGELCYTQDLGEALTGADCAVLVTRHREYLGAELLKEAAAMRTRVVVDGRGRLDGKACEAFGLVYGSLGRGRRGRIGWGRRARPPRCHTRRRVPSECFAMQTTGALC